MTREEREAVAAYVLAGPAVVRRWARLSATERQRLRAQRDEARQTAALLRAQVQDLARALAEASLGAAATQPMDGT